MRIIVRFLSLVLVASFLFGSQAVLAEGEAPAAGPIDETFDVREHLTTGGQKESKFVPPKEPSPGEEASKPVNAATFLVDVIDLLVKLIGSVALIIFILGALLTVTSEGKEDRLEKGKTAMLYALIGLIIAFFSFIIVSFVQSIFF